MRILILLVLLCGITSQAQAINYYFSSQIGDDTRTNLQAQNPLTPWRTTDKLNAINLSLKPGDSIFFRRGDVFSGSIVVRSSGNATNRIYYGAYGTGANPVISGFTTLSNWTLLRGGIYSAPLDVATLNMVTINNEAKGMGRFPNTGFLKYENNNSNLSITDNELPATPNWSGAEIVVRKYRFILDRHTVTSHSGTTLNYSTSTAYGNNTAFRPVKNNGYFIQNHLNTLDQQGEWYYDAAAKRLYVHFGSSNPSNFVVKAASRDYNVFVTTANFLTFENLNLEGGNTKGFFMQTTSNTLVQNCNFFNQGGVSFDALDVSWITLKGGSVNTSFSNGVFFEHNANNCTVDGVTVHNTNMIPGTSRSGTGISVGITINGNGSRIINNKVINSGYNGISFLGDNVLVEKNYVDTYCTLKDDGGGIYTYIGESNSTSYNRKVKNNLILNGIGAKAGTEAYSYESFGKAAGIYLDEHVNNVEVTGNTVANGDWSGIFLHNAHHNVISNNIFYNHRYQVLVSQYTAMTRANNMTNNQYISKYGYQETFYYRTFVDDSPATMGGFDNNFYARPIDDNRTIHCDFYQSGGSGTQYYTLDQWKQNFSLDRSSSRSPITYRTNIDDSIRFEFNATDVPRVIALDANYVDVRNTFYSGNLTLAPNTGLVLLKTRTTAKLAQTITFPAITSQTFGSAPFTMAATASSGLPVSYRVVSGPATISGNTVTLTGAGSLTIEATQAGNGTYNPALPVAQTIAVAKASQIISFGTLPNKVGNDAPFIIGATASSGLPVSYRVITGPATVNGNTVTLTGAIGTVWIEASQAGDSNYNIANAVSQSFYVSSPVVSVQNQTITFPVISNRTFGDASFPLAATASSGLPVSYRVVSGPATVSGNTVTITGAGNVLIEALQGGNASFNPASPVQRSFVVEKAGQSISFAALDNKIIGSVPFALDANATSGLPVNFRLVSGPATLAGDIVTLTGAGTVVIEAIQNGNDNFTAAIPVQQSFVVASTNTGKQSQTITFNSIGYKTYTSPDFPLIASATSELPVLFRVVSGPITIKGDIVEIVGVGSVVIEAYQPGDAEYNAANPVQRSFTVGKAGQVLTFPHPTDKVLGDLPFSLNAVASSGLSVNYRVVSGPAAVTGNVVTLLGSGTVTLEASQPGNSYFTAAFPLQRSFTVRSTGSVRLAQTITFPVITNKAFGDEPFQLAATASSDLPVSYRIMSGPAAVENDMVTVTGTGTVTIEALQTGDATFLAAAPVTRSFVIEKGEQAVIFAEIADINFGDGPVSLNASASSQLPVSFRVISGPATLTGNTVTATGPGTVIVEASQQGDNNYHPAAAVTQSFSVNSLNKVNQTISFGTLGYKTYTSPDFTLSAIASSGLPVSFRVVSGPVTLNGNEVSINGVGSVTIEAFQTGNGSFNAAPPVQRSFTVGKAGQVLTFSGISNRSFSTTPFALNASASSGLPVAYRVVSGPATVNGNMVTLTGTGTVTIEALQPGDAYFTPAFPLQRTFSVTGTTSLPPVSTTAMVSSTTETMIVATSSTVTLFPNPARSQATISVTAAKTMDGVLEVVDMQGRVVLSLGTKRFEKGQPTNIQLNVSRFISGVYILRLAAREEVLTHRFQVVR